MKMKIESKSERERKFLGKILKEKNNGKRKENED
jgi:hypothetical protein